VAGLLSEKCKQKAKMPEMAFSVHIKRLVMDAIDQRDESRGQAALWLIAAGAALAGYVLRTPRGRRAFDEVIGMLDDFSTSAARFSEACTRAQHSVSESWNAVTGGIASKSIRTR